MIIFVVQRNWLLLFSNLATGRDMCKSGLRNFVYKCAFGSSLSIRNVERNRQRYHTLHILICMYYYCNILWLLNVILFLPLLLLTLFKYISFSHISRRLSGEPDSSIAAVSWTAAYHRILIPHGCKCIWMAFIWCESCAYLRTGSPEPPVWAAHHGTSSNLWCHLDFESTQLPV